MRRSSPQVFKKALLDDLIKKSGGAGAAKKPCSVSAWIFPPCRSTRNRCSAEEYLLSTSQGVSNREIVLEEMLLLWLANVNPAFSPFRELFDDSSLDKDTRLSAAAWTALKEFFSRQPPFGPDSQNLIDMLRSPALAFPDSLSGQLQLHPGKMGLAAGQIFGAFSCRPGRDPGGRKNLSPGSGPGHGF